MVTLYVRTAYFLWILITLEVVPVTSRVIPRPLLRHIQISDYFAKAPLTTRQRSLKPEKFENSVLRKSNNSKAKTLVVFLMKQDNDSYDKLKSRAVLPATKIYDGNSRLSEEKIFGKNDGKFSPKSVNEYKLWNKYPVKVPLKKPKTQRTLRVF